MAEVKWTDDQQKAIDTTDKGVVVSAAAGSGKTAVLIERTVKMLSDEKAQIPADRILAVTFTNDATAQMREKLSVALDKKLRENPTSKWLCTQQSRMAMAKINTINSFCYDFVKSNSQLLDCREDVGIIEENDAIMLFSKAVDITFEQWYKTRPDDMKTLNDSLSQENDSNLINLVTRLNKFLMSIPFAERWEEKAISMFTDGSGYQLWSDVLWDKATEEFEICKKAMEKIQYILERVEAMESAKACLAQDYNSLDTLARVLEKRDGSAIGKISEYIIFPTLSLKITKKLAFAFDERQLNEEVLLIESIKELRESYKKISRDIVSQLGGDEPVCKEQLRFEGELFDLLCQLTEDCRSREWDLKLERNCLEFSDVENLTVRLLLKPVGDGYERTQLAEEIVKSQIYKVILIDEFQDVNNLQELIFKAISDTDDLNVLGKNVFVVGDVKQSIYGFRQSNPQLFRNARVNANNADFASQLCEIKLKKNFRSRDNIVDFVNFVFSQLMSDSIGSVEYDEDEALQFGADYDTSRKVSTDCLVVKTEKAIETDDEIAYVPYTQEHLAVANYIRRLIDDQLEVSDKGSLRPCRPSDFCILVRNNKSSGMLVKALETAGLKAFSEEVSGYLRSREVSVMINLLKVIDNPLQDIPLLSVMMSPVMNFTANEVSVIRLLCVKEGTGIRKKLYQVMNGIASGVDADAHEKESDKIIIEDKAITRKCVYAAQLIKKIRFFAASMPLEALIRKVYEETDFYCVSAVYENSKQMRGNLRLLLEYASSYDNSTDGGLQGFVRYLDNLIANKKDFKQAATITESGDCVNVKTMHRSKGLEYPIVVLCDCSKLMNFKDCSASILLDRDFGVGMGFHNVYNLSNVNTISRKCLAYRKKIDTLSEELRLLYVALTRAKEKLCIPVSIKSEDIESEGRSRIESIAMQVVNNGGFTPSVIRSCKSMQEWLCVTLLSCKDSDFLERELAMDFSVPKSDKSPNVKFYNGDLICHNNPPVVLDEHLKKTPTVIKSAQQLKQNLSYDFNAVESQTLSKLTVTEIVKAEQEKEYGDKNPEFYPQLPRMSDEIGRLTHAERGTYTHLFMELADYDRAMISVEDEIFRLVDKKLFTPKQAEGIYVEALKGFFAGDFYQRMKLSKKILREKKFMIALGELNLNDKFDVYKNTDGMVQGIADCIFEEDDGYVLVDYKTDKFASEDDIAKYSTQLEIYRSAFDLILDKPVKSCYIYSFWLEKGFETVYGGAK